MNGAFGKASSSSGTIGPFGPSSKLVVRMVGRLKNFPISAERQDAVLEVVRGEVLNERDQPGLMVDHQEDRVFFRELLVFRAHFASLQSFGWWIQVRRSGLARLGFVSQSSGSGMTPDPRAPGRNDRSSSRPLPARSALGSSRTKFHQRCRSAFDRLATDDGQVRRASRAHSRRGARSNHEHLARSRTSRPPTSISPLKR